MIQCAQWGKMFAVFRALFPLHAVVKIHGDLSTDPDEQVEKDEVADTLAAQENSTWSQKVANAAQDLANKKANEAQGTNRHGIPGLTLISQLRMELKTAREFDIQKLETIFHKYEPKRDDKGFVIEGGYHARTLAHIVCMRSIKECPEPEQVKFLTWLREKKFNLFAVDDYKRIPAFYAAYQDEGKVKVLQALTDDKDGEKSFGVHIDEYRIGSTLNKKERHMRSFIFVLIALLFIGGLSVNQVNLSCNTFFGGIVLTPYIVIVANVFLFKIVQWFFDTRIVPFVRSVRRIKSVDRVVGPFLKDQQMFWGKEGPPARLIQRLSSSMRLSIFASPAPAVLDEGADVEYGIDKKLSTRIGVNPFHAMNHSPRDSANSSSPRSSDPTPIPTSPAFMAELTKTVLQKNDVKSALGLDLEPRIADVANVQRGASTVNSHALDLSHPHAASKESSSHHRGASKSAPPPPSIPPTTAATTAAKWATGELR